MTASVSLPSSTAVTASSCPGRRVVVAEPLAGDVADAPGARGHPRCDLSSLLDGDDGVTDRGGSQGTAGAAAPDAPGRSRRLPVPGREGPRDLRRQGEVDPQPRHLALLEQPPRDGQRDRPHRVRARLQRGGGAARRAELHQAVQAALQRPAARRQVLSVHRDLDGRGVPARLLHARAPSPGPPVLRPVLQRQARPRHARPPREDLPVPLVHRRRAGPAQRLAVPGLLHQALRGALRRLRLAGGVPRLDRRGRRVPAGPLPRDRARPRAAHEGGRRRAGVRAGGARAQPAARRPLAARAPARRQRVGRHARRGRRRRRRHGRERPGLPGPRRRAERPPVLLPRQRRGSGRSATSPRSSSCSTTPARSRSRRRSSCRARSRTSTRSASC